MSDLTQLKNEIGEEMYQRIQNMTLMNNALMSKVFEDPECVKLLLQIILKREDIEIISSNVQHVINNLQGRSITLDILAKEQYGEYFNVEIQRSDEGADFKRARYHSSLLDANFIPKNTEFKNMNDSYVIFITENDYVGLGLPIYHIEKTILENQQPILDGAHIIYVNAEKTDSTKLGMLMHDFRCANYEDMNYDILKNRTRYFKSQKEGLTDMWELIEDWEIELADKITKRVTKEVTDQVTKEVTEQVTKQVTEQVTKEVTAQVTIDVTEQVTREVTDQVTKDVTDQVTKQVTDQVTREVTDQVTKEVTESSNQKTVQILKNHGLSVEQIAKDLSLTLDQVRHYLSE